MSNLPPNELPKESPSEPLTYASASTPRPGEPDTSDRQPPDTKYDKAALGTLGVLGMIFCLPFAAAVVLGLVAMVRAPNAVMLFGTITGAVMTVAIFTVSRRLLRVSREHRV